MRGASAVPIEKAKRERMGGDRKRKEKEGAKQRRGGEGVSVGVEGMGGGRKTEGGEG